MSGAIKKCYLQCLKDISKKIHLQDSQKFCLGRNEESDIKDINVSRKQLECTANFGKNEVSVKTTGRNFSGCNGYALLKNTNYYLKHGDILEVRLGFHQFGIVFEPNEVADENSGPSTSKKAKYSIFNSVAPAKSVKISGNWECIDDNELLIYTPNNCDSQSNIAAFDMDGTLIKTKSGARFPKDENDWVLNFNNIQEKLEELQNNYKIVIFTNQSGVGKDPSKIKGFKRKIENVVSKLAVPIQVFVALGKSVYRKPLPGMWDTLCETKNEVAINTSQSFYVGDAAGREKNWAPKKNKDHSIADRLFALNIGLKFYTPEDFFLKQSEVPYQMPEFDPRHLPTINYPSFSTDEQEAILMVGCQGSGKSYFCKTQLKPKGYICINRDTVGSWQKCAKILEESLKNQKNVVIDNTHPDKESRKKYLDVIKSANVKCRCFVMSTSLKHSKHNNKFRELTDKSHVHVSEILINSYNKNFQEPELTEGFTEIFHIPFVPDFESPEHEKLYKLFLLES